MGHWSWNPNTNEVHWSDNMCRLHGIEPSKFNPTFDFAIQYTHPDDIEYVKKNIEYLLNEKKTLLPSEYRIVTSKDEIKWVQGTSQILLDDNGNIVEIIGTIQDITVRSK